MKTRRALALPGWRRAHPAAASVLALAVLSGCASRVSGPGGPGGASGGAAPVAAAAPTATLPAAWQASQPAGLVAAAPGAAATDPRAEALRRWWSQFDDPQLLALIDAAQQASPTLSAAELRIAQARSARTRADGEALLASTAQASAARGREQPGSPTGQRYSAALQAAWELDLFGALRAGRQAAQARFDGAVAAWHDARTAVAAEAAATYVQLRACEAQADWGLRDSRSREETARLTELAAQAGFRAPADAALARGGAAQARSQAVQLQAQCDRHVKALVALTAQAEPALRERLQASRARLPLGAPPPVLAVPGELLRHRPDLVRAERELLATAAEVEQSRARERPQVTLSGSIGAMRLESGADGGNGAVWAIGPLAVALPVFDGGRRAAATQAARAAHDDAQRQYLAALRQAVRDVEDALVRVEASARREPDIRDAAQALDAVLKAVEARWQGGLASQFELEDARRNAFAAASLYVDLQRERLEAAIALYRALGGGWHAADPSPAPN